MPQRQTDKERAIEKERERRKIGRKVGTKTYTATPFTSTTSTDTIPQ